MLEEWVFLVSNLGFPIFTALFLMIEMKKIIKENTKAINSLEKLVQGCHRRI